MFLGRALRDLKSSEIGHFGFPTRGLRESAYAVGFFVWVHSFIFCQNQILSRVGTPKKRKRNSVLYRSVPLCAPHGTKCRRVYSILRYTTLCPKAFVNDGAPLPIDIVVGMSFTFFVVRLRPDGIFLSEITFFFPLIFSRGWF